MVLTFGTGRRKIGTHHKPSLSSLRVDKASRRP
jgi:hypothetical protein